MPSKEEILEKKTFKGDISPIEKRIFYTLTDETNVSAEADKILQANRTTKLVSLLIKQLVDREILDESDIDEMLLECIA